MANQLTDPMAYQRAMQLQRQREVRAAVAKITVPAIDGVSWKLDPPAGAELDEASVPVLSIVQFKLQADAGRCFHDPASISARIWQATLQYTGSIPGFQGVAWGLSIADDDCSMLCLQQWESAVAWRTFQRSTGLMAMMPFVEKTLTMTNCCAKFSNVPGGLSSIVESAAVLDMLSVKVDSVHVSSPEQKLAFEETWQTIVDASRPDVSEIAHSIKDAREGRRLFPGPRGYFQAHGELFSGHARSNAAAHPTTAPLPQQHVDVAWLRTKLGSSPKRFQMLFQRLADDVAGLAGFAEIRWARDVDRPSNVAVLTVWEDLPAYRAAVPAHRRFLDNLVVASAGLVSSANAYQTFSLDKLWSPNQTLWHYYQGKECLELTEFRDDSLTKLEPDYWIELEKSYQTRLTARHALLAEHGEKILFCEPDEHAALACRELLEMALQFVCHRYPEFFVVEGNGQDRVFVNRILQTKTSLSDNVVDGHKSLQILFANIPEDFALVQRDPTDGRYRLRAAMVCSSVGWYIGKHRGKPLRDIHGNVTDYATKMARSMDRYFARMPTDQPIQRGSWSIEQGQPLFVPDETERVDNADVVIDDLHLRCDWQTLRRLPLTGAIVFNFKATFTPVAELRTEPFVPGLLHHVLSEGDPRLITPGKCMTNSREVVLPALKTWTEEQVASGLVPADWEPRTLDDSPFFPGWEAKWHAEQGF
ncbi:hypothetical protein SBRCBS47491_007276 [Sporothrix bragantina]|uniref:ABM domain-containing protein n=1 Tax=Sporothrix bragantina TaxID=671064 RepID=A0ABP0CBY0_9PEZI